MRLLRRLLAPSLVGVILTSSGLAMGRDTATAEQLFRQGLEFLKQRQFKEACDAFAGSNDVDPSPGTEINLALCNEKQGNIASAWGWYRTAAGLAEQRGQKERADLARAEAAKLEGKVHKLVVEVSAVDRENVVLSRDGQVVPLASLGVPMPIDPGEHTLEVRAPKKQPWIHVIRIAKEPGTDRIDVPPLADAREATTTALSPTLPAMPPPAAERTGSSQRTIGFVLGGAGIVAAVVAVGLEWLATREEEKSKDAAAIAADTTVARASRDAYLESATSHHNAAKSDELIAVASGAGAVVLLGVGVTLVLTAPTTRTSAATLHVVPVASHDGAGVGLIGAF